MDENRYSAGHLTLKRAEKARALAYKIPGMVEALTAKVQNWEDERSAEFMYDGNRLRSMLEEYTIARQEKEQEKKRQREQKKLQGLGACQDSKSSSLKSTKKASRTNKGFLPQTPRAESTQSSRTASNSRPTKKDDRSGTQSPVRRAQGITRNYTFHGRESEHTVVGRPLSPTSSSRPNADQFDDQNSQHGDIMHKSLPKNETSREKVNNSSKVPSTPSKTSPTEDEENTSPTKSLHGEEDEDDDDEEEDEEVEYSFEETRAGFVLPERHTTRP